MKKSMLHWLILGLLPAISYAQDCPCDDGTSEYTVDCDGDGVNDACSTEDCGPCHAGNPATSGKSCCGGEEYKPDKQIDFSPIGVDTGKIVEAFQTVRSGFTGLYPCNDTTSAAPNVSMEVGFFDLCCSDELKSKRHVKGKVTWDMGIQCDWPIFGCPYVASLNAAFGVGFSGDIQAGKKETCEGGKMCFSGNVSGNISGGASATAAAGVIRVSCVVQGVLTTTVSWCMDEPVEIGAFQPSAAIVGTAELAFFTKEINYPIYP